MERAAEKHSNIRNTLLGRMKAEVAKTRRNENEDSKAGMRNRCRRINGPVAAPLLYVIRDDKCAGNHEPGTYTTNPQEVDSVVRTAWQKRYTGNVENANHVAKQFAAKYSKYLFRLPPQEAPPIIVELVHVAFSKGGKSAAGMDSWEPEEMALMSMEGCRWTARFYTMIEAGEQ